jgi:myo-inositol-1(or 4)-monophosphatase
MRFSKETRVAIKAVRVASKLIMTNFGKSKHFRKRNKTVVTKADIEAEKIITEILKKHFPSYAVAGEESGKESGTYTWFVDPIDGTENFARYIPLFSTSIALQKNKKTVLGVVYDPIHDELFVAEKGRGAYLNNKKIRVSTISEYAIISLTKKHALIKKKFFHSRFFGAAALTLASIAAGRIEGKIQYDMDMYSSLAGFLLVEEAGGKITDFKGKKLKIQKKMRYIASNKKMHSFLMRIA